MTDLGKYKILYSSNLELKTLEEIAEGLDDPQVASSFVLWFLSRILESINVNTGKLCREDMVKMVKLLESIGANMEVL